MLEQPLRSETASAQQAMTSNREDLLAPGCIKPGELRLDLMIFTKNIFFWRNLLLTVKPPKESLQHIDIW